MADDPKIWVKNPQTGEVLSISTPEEIHAAQANKFVNATQEEADKAYRQEQLQGWKGTALAAGAGVADVVPFARNIVRRAAPALGQEVDESVEAHPVVHGIATLATIAATAGIGGETAAVGKAAEAGVEGVGALTAIERAVPAAVERAAIASKDPAAIRAALGNVEGALAKVSSEAAGQTGVAKAVPSLAARVLGRVPEAAKNAQLGLAYSGIELTNEKDLGRTPEEVAGHVMGSLFWGAVGGAAGGEVVHGVLKAASPVVRSVGKAFGSFGEKVEGIAGAIKAGGDPSAVVNKARGGLQRGLDAIDQMAKPKAIDKAMEAVRVKVGDAGMGELDAMRIKAEDAVEAARADVMRLLGQKGTGKISADRLARALKSDERQDVIEALQRLHEAGKGLRDFHEQLFQAGASGVEDLAGKTKEQVEGLLEVQDAMKAGIAAEAGKTGLDDVIRAGVVGEVAAHFGHALFGKAYIAAKVGKKLMEMAPAEFKAARLAQLARLSEGVDGHLDRVASALHAGGPGKYAAPRIAAMTGDELHKLRDEVQAKLANPQLAQDHLEERAAPLQEFAPDTYGQMAVQYGQQLQVLASILQWPEMPGIYGAKWELSPTERAQIAAKVAIVKDPRVFEAHLARGTATPAEAKVYQQAHPARAAALGQRVLSGIREGHREDNASLKAMTGMMVMGITPRASYSQATLAGVQGLYSQRANQQGGPGSRGGTSGAAKLSASQMISLPGQRVSNRPVK